MKYMLIYRERDDTELSEELTEKRIAAYYKWADKVGSSLIEGHKLKGDFQIFHRNDVVDRPLTESKEIIAGLSIIEVNSKEQAQKIAMEHPFTNDFDVILREIT